MSWLNKKKGYKALVKEKKSNEQEQEQEQKQEQTKIVLQEIHYT